MADPISSVALEERLYTVHTDPEQPPQKMLEFRARKQPVESPHVVHVMLVAPGVTPTNAGQEVYNRLQDLGCDEEAWSFIVTHASPLGGAPTPLLGLDSGDDLELLLDMAHG